MLIKSRGGVAVANPPLFHLGSEQVTLPFLLDNGTVHYLPH